LNNKSKNQISRPGGFFSKSGSCYNPLFFDQIQIDIQRYQPILAVFCTENDPVTGTHFHSDFLPNQMSTLGYKLLTRDKYIDDDGSNALRMSIFILSGAQSITSVELSKGIIFNDNKFECSRTYLGAPRALVLYVQTLFGRFGFVGVQVPREVKNEDRTICESSLVNKFISGKNLDSYFIMGDFANEYIIQKKDLNINNIDTLRREGLKQGLEENLVSLPQGGTSGLGNKKFLVPTYSPAYSDKFVGSDNADIKTFEDLENYPYDQIELGYHDRIFHKTLQGYPIVDIDYKAIVGSPMLSSDNNKPVRDRNHLGVLGIYSFQGQSY
jgi:hypothetical protein